MDRHVFQVIAKDDFIHTAHGHAPVTQVHPRLDARAVFKGDFNLHVAL